MSFLLLQLTLLIFQDVLFTEIHVLTVSIQRAEKLMKRVKSMGRIRISNEYVSRKVISLVTTFGFCHIFNEFTEFSKIYSGNSPSERAVEFINRSCNHFFTR